MSHEVKVGMMVCTPMPYRRGTAGNLVHETISPIWHRKRMALSHPTNFSMIEIFADGMEVADARNQTIQKALDSEYMPEFVFFLDYDVLPEFDALNKLIYRARHFPNIDIFAGVYVCKGITPSEPLIYAGDGTGPFWDWTVGDLLTTESHGITGTHMGLTLIRTSLFKDRDWMWDEDDPWFRTKNEKTIDKNGVQKTERGTEDLFFYKRARERDQPIQIMVDTSVLAGHIDVHTGVIWGLPPDCGPCERAKWMDRPWDKTSEDKKEDVKIALDLGAGATRREWVGHKTYTTDLRPDTGADYVQDSRYLNLPDNHFDLVASSHHLEHIPRMEQEQVWEQVFRVCKPDGKIEMIVPSLEWAAAKITEGGTENLTHVMNILYGAQEDHGYERLLNTHFMGYTKEVAVALAENAGFENVTTEDWRDEPLNGYNLIIRGDKPGIVAIKLDEDEDDSENGLAEGNGQVNRISELIGGKVDG